MVSGGNHFSLKKGTQRLGHTFICVVSIWYIYLEFLDAQDVIAACGFTSAGVVMPSRQWADANACSRSQPVGQRVDSDRSDNDVVVATF